MSSTSAVYHYYLKELRRVLHGTRALLAFAVASAMHAAGHALFALLASALALSLSVHLDVRTLARMTAGGGSRFTDNPFGSNAFLLSLMGLGVVVVKGGAGVYATYVQGRLAGQVGCSLRMELLDALFACHRVRQPRHPDHGSGTDWNFRSESSLIPLGALGAAPPKPPMPAIQAVATLVERVREVEVGLERGLLGGARAAAQLLPLAAVLVFLSPAMAAMAAAVFVAFGWALGGLRAGYRARTRRATREHEKLLEAADESMRYAELWVTYGAEQKARASVLQQSEAIAAGSARLQARAAALSASNELLGSLALVGAIGASQAGLIGPVASGPTLLAFFVTFFLAYKPLREMAEARLALERSQGAYDELRRVAAASGFGITHVVAKSEWTPGGALELRELRLARGTCGPLSLRVEPGAVAVIVGPTGVGKTTLLRTLLGLDSARSGEIRYDGRRIDAAPAGPGSRPFAWVAQDAPLLADTLSANVALGEHSADPGAVLSRLGAARLVDQLRGARLGGGGRQVSGGERQWIALARAVASGQPVLLLDEPTSSLDADSQSVVLAAIARLRGERTVLLVTHRPEPLALADLVIHLDPETPAGTITDTTGPGSTVTQRA
jgi:ABC-type multidrug transport system fused ATPase/permease subunit